MKIYKIDPGSKELMSALISLDRLIATPDWVNIYQAAAAAAHVSAETLHTTINQNIKLHLKK